MANYVKLPVSSHPWRCIDEDGTYCPHITVSNFGTRWHCQLFTLGNDELPERDGCLERHPECVANQVEGDDICCNRR